MAYRQQQSFDGSTHELNQGGHHGAQQSPYVDQGGYDQGGYDQGYSQGPSRVRGGAGESAFRYVVCVCVGGGKEGRKEVEGKVLGWG